MKKGVEDLVAELIASDVRGFQEKHGRAVLAVSFDSEQEKQVYEWLATNADLTPKEKVSSLAALLKTFPHEALIYVAVGAILNFQGHSQLHAAAHDARILDRKAIAANRKASSIHAANARHDKPGASRGKQDQIKEIWASGKYTTRDICAEQECAALDMSFSAARKALRNTPEPNRS